MINVNNFRGDLSDLSVKIISARNSVITWRDRHYASETKPDPLQQVHNIVWQPISRCSSWNNMILLAKDTSVADLAEISIRSPRTLCIFIIKKNMHHYIFFEKRSSAPHKIRQAVRRCTLGDNEFFPLYVFLPSVRNH